MIKIRGFSKRYGQFVAVDSLDLDIEQGDVFGFIGAGARSPCSCESIP